MTGTPAEQAPALAAGALPPASYTPLHDPENEPHVFVPTLERAISQARKVCDEKAAANIHDQDQMIRAAYGLHCVLADLLAALDAERGERR